MYHACGMQGTFELMKRVRDVKEREDDLTRKGWGTSGLAKLNATHAPHTDHQLPHQLSTPCTILGPNSLHTTTISR